MDKRKIVELMEMLGVEETVDQMAKANRVRWYGHVVRRDEGHVLKRALDFEVDGKRKQGQPKKMPKKYVEEESKKVGLRRKDATNRAMWRAGMREIAAAMN